MKVIRPLIAIAALSILTGACARSVSHTESAASTGPDRACLVVIAANAGSDPDITETATGSPPAA